MWTLIEVISTIIILGCILAILVVLNQGTCFHKFKVSGGMFGKCWKCEKCMLDRYPEGIAFKDIYKLLKRVEE